jgi:hypothetical protein
VNGKTILWTVAAIAATVLSSGCKHDDDEFAPAVLPKTYTFEGKIEPKFAGSWKTADGNSSIDLSKDGSVSMETIIRSVAGKNTSKVSGKWLATSDSIVFQYTIGSQKPTTVKYMAALDGNTLTLQQPESKVKTVYKRV